MKINTFLSFENFNRCDKCFQALDDEAQLQQKRHRVNMKTRVNDSTVQRNIETWVQVATGVLDH